MRIKERLSCAVGNVFNDLFRQLAQSYELFFLMKIVELSPSEAALIILIGQIADASFSPIAGYLGDSANVPFLSKKIGRRKSWHCLATVFMAIGLPFFFNRCLLCSFSNQNWLRLFYFCFISALINICFNVVEINHLAFITTVAASVEECTVLSAMRYVLNVTVWIVNHVHLKHTFVFSIYVQYFHDHNTVGKLLEEFLPAVLKVKN